MNELNEAKEYIDQFIHVKSNTKNRIEDVVKKFIEVPEDNTKNHYIYTCLDCNENLVIEFSVDMNNNAELIDDVDCY